MNIPHKISIGNSQAKDCKINNDIQLILTKHKDYPIEDIRLIKIEIFHTDLYIVGLQVVYELVDQHKKHDTNHNFNEKITYEFKGHKSKGSKLRNVKSSEFQLGPQETINKVYGESTEQINKISFQTNTGKTYSFPPNQLINISIKPYQQFYFEIPLNSTIIAFTSGFSRFLNFIEINYRTNAPSLNNPGRIQSQFPQQYDIINGHTNINQMNQIQNMNQFQPNLNQVNLNNSDQFQGNNIGNNFSYPIIPSGQLQQHQIDNQNQLYNYPRQSQIQGLNQPNLQLGQQQQNQQLPNQANNHQSNYQNKPRNQLNMGFQKSNTMQVQGSNPTFISQQFNQNQHSNNNNNHSLNIQNIPQKYPVFRQSQLMRGQSLSDEYLQQQNQELQIYEQLQDILYKKNNKVKLSIKGHLIQQSDSIILSLLSPKKTSHVTYLIEIDNLQNQGSDQKVIVHRRYKEFDALREYLLESFPGLPIPMLPEKTFGKNFDEKFIEDRKEELQIFLDELNLYKLLSKSQGTLMFLNPSVSSKDLLSDLKKMKNNVEGKKYILYPKYIQTFQCIANYQLKQKQIDEVEEFKNFLGKKIEIVERLKAKAQKTKEKMINYYEFLNNFKKNFIKDYEVQVLQGYEYLDSRKVNTSQQQNVNYMSDQDIMFQQTQISNQAFIQQYQLMVREYQILSEFLRIFSYQSVVNSQHAKLSEKLLRTKVNADQKEMQQEVCFLKWMDLFITKIFYFILIPFHKREQSSRYYRTVANTSEIEKINNDNMRQYWLFVMLQEQIKYDSIKQANNEQKNQQQIKQNQQQIYYNSHNQQKNQIPNNCNIDNHQQYPEKYQNNKLYNQDQEEQKINVQDYNTYYNMFSNQNHKNYEQNTYSNYPVKNDQKDKYQQFSQYPSIQKDESINNNKNYDQNDEQNLIHNQKLNLKPINEIKQKLNIQQEQNKTEQQNENDMFQQLIQLDLQDTPKQQQQIQQYLKDQQSLYQQYNDKQKQKVNNNNNYVPEDEEQQRQAQLLYE